MTIAYARIEAPTVAAITLSEAKAHLRVTHDAEDALIGDLVLAAIDHMERDLGIGLINQTWRAHADCLPSDRILELARHPVRSITAVTAYDRSGDPVPVPGAVYSLNMLTRPATLRFESGSQTFDASNGIEIDFSVGYGATGVDLPPVLKRALLVLIAHWYEFRGAFDASDQPVSIPAAYARLVQSERRVGL